MTRPRSDAAALVTAGARDALPAATRGELDWNAPGLL